MAAGNDFNELENAASNSPEEALNLLEKKLSERKLEEKNDTSNKAVILWLMIFPPVGLVLIWTKSAWKPWVKFAVTGLIILSFAVTIYAVYLPIKTVNELYNVNSGIDPFSEEGLMENMKFMLEYSH